MPNFDNPDAAADAGRLSSRAGVRNRRTIEWEALGEFMTEAGAEKVMTYLNTLEGEEFFKRYDKLLNYFKPKMQSTDVKTSGSLTLNQITGVEIIKDVDEIKTEVTGQTT